MNRKKQKVLGYDVDIISFDDTIRFLIERIKNKQGIHVVTINPEIIEQAQKNKELDEIIRKAELVVADGIGIQLALKLKGINQERIPGVDLAIELINHCNSLRYSIAMIGAKEDVIRLAVNNLEERYSDLDICYFRNGYFTLPIEEKIIDDLSQAEPDVILVALGSPKQDFFIKKCREKVPNAIYIGVGGSFDVWAGIVERAPEFFRIMGIEWLYRTYKQPKRLKRIYKTLPLFAFKAIIEAIQYRLFLHQRGKNDKSN